ncbi:WGxxGxxG family protein [Deinococcus sp. QL22]|uniref:WGxxGxxG family protein n=1 Tax=Deinococcus sp. QL22 TaxID=2939437 RepID=UPI0020173AFC|nr:WGxxGxxG family protein [Deinococcus sp. QL22]UQN10052.1 WGxxGxxG-CTERM domain-containing protein [Deinococcus sp. QL22]
MTLPKKALILTLMLTLAPLPAYAQDTTDTATTGTDTTVQTTNNNNDGFDWNWLGLLGLLGLAGLSGRREAVAPARTEVRLGGPTDGPRPS